MIERMHRAVLIAVMLSAAALLAALAPAARVTSGVASAAFRPTADAYVDAGAPDANHGRSTELRTDGSPLVRSYVRFAVSGLAGDVEHAFLRVYANTALRAPGIEVHGVPESPWSETGVTFATAPRVSARTTATSGAVAAGTWVELDVTALVHGDGAVSLALTSTGTRALSLGSRESGHPPQLVVETRELQVGAYYYAWYGTGRRHWSAGYLRHELNPPQAPALGEYDSRSPSTIAAHFRWAHDYGVDFFAVSWAGAGEYSDITTRDYLLKSPAIGNTKIAIFYESIANLGAPSGRIVFDDAVEAKLISDVDYLARTYFSNPHYLRIGGKPVLILYVTRIFDGAYAKAIADLRATIRARYGYGLYLVGDEVDWDSTPNPARIRLWNAITGYTMYSDLQTAGWPDDTRFLAGVRQRYAAFRAAASSAGVAFIPDAQPAFNDRGVRLSANHYVLPFEVNASFSGAYSLFSRFLDVAGNFVDPRARTLLVTSFNEWHEDTELEPLAPAPPTSAPAVYTRGYEYRAHGTVLLQMLKRFADAWPAP